MEIQEVEIVINKKGKVEIHMKGFHGEECLIVTQELEEALGGNVEMRELLASYFDQQSTQDQQDTLDLHT